MLVIHNSSGYLIFLNTLMFDIIFGHISSGTELSPTTLMTMSLYPPSGSILIEAAEAVAKTSRASSCPHMLLTSTGSIHAAKREAPCYHQRYKMLQLAGCLLNSNFPLLLLFLSEFLPKSNRPMTLQLSTMSSWRFSENENNRQI